MVGLMCQAPPDVQRQLSAALALISASDFPQKWPTLLPELIAKFNEPDVSVTLGVLLTANSIMKRFRYVFKSDALFADLKFVLEQLHAPLLALFKTMGEHLARPDVGASAAQAGVVMEALRLICRIFYSLNWQDIPECFEDSMAEWMGGFVQYLSYANPALLRPDEENEPGPIEKLQAAVVENVNLYADKYEEEFQPHLPSFTTAIWGLATQVRERSLRSQNVPSHSGSRRAGRRAAQVRRARDDVDPLPHVHRRQADARGHVPGRGDAAPDRAGDRRAQPPAARERRGALRGQPRGVRAARHGGLRLGHAPAVRVRPRARALQEL